MWRVYATRRLTTGTSQQAKFFIRSSSVDVILDGYVVPPVRRSGIWEKHLFQLLSITAHGESGTEHPRNSGHPTHFTASPFTPPFHSLSFFFPQVLELSSNVAIPVIGQNFFFLWHLRGKKESNERS